MLLFLKRVGKNTGRTFWIYALGEFLLVFLGILIALQVENWNQDRKDRKLEHVLLSEMLDNLKGDLEGIDYNNRYHKRLVSSNQVVIDYLKSDLPWHDTLGGYFDRLMGGALFEVNTSSYESLKTIGIDLIRNDQLRKQITDVYTNRYSHVEGNEEILFKYIFDHLYPAIRKNLRTVSPKELHPINLEELRYNHAFLEELNMNIFISQLTIRAYNMASESVVELIAAIEKELGLDPGSTN